MKIIIVKRNSYDSLGFIVFNVCDGFVPFFFRKFSENELAQTFGEERRKKISYISEIFAYNTVKPRVSFQCLVIKFHIII